MLHILLYKYEYIIFNVHEFTFLGIQFVRMSALANKTTLKKIYCI